MSIALVAAALLVFPVITTAQTADEVATIRQLFAPKNIMDSKLAFESDFYKKLVETQQAKQGKLQNQSEINSINAKIDRLEKSSAGNAKSGGKTEQELASLRDRKAYLEVQDAAILAKYTQASYDKWTVKSAELYAQNKTGIESRSVVHSFMQNLFAESEKNMNAGNELATQSFSELNNMKRSSIRKSAFVHEALAIEQLEQMCEICNQMPFILKFSNEQLAAMLQREAPATVVEEKTVIVETIAEDRSDKKAQAVAPTELPAEQPEVLPMMVKKTVEKTDPKPVEQPTVKQTVAKAGSTLDCIQTTNGSEIFFTIQIGAFSKEVEPDALKPMSLLCTDKSESGLVRYISGKYNSLYDANQALEKVKNQGFADAFIAAYSNNKRVSIKTATELLHTSSTR